MSRLKLKVNNCLLNNKEFFKLFNSIFNKIGYNGFIIFQDYLNIKILKYDENFQIFWNFWTLNFIWKMLTPYQWYIDPPTHGISTSLPMVFWPPYPWYFEPPIHGILTLLPMVYWPPYPWYIDPHIHAPLPIEYRLFYTWYFDLPA
jgi:hypothetical protein